ncbi:N-acetyltransferase [uncultured Proteiniphilum sp.]|uniref:GNAT family N-acetyltransferase n=1 Tax=uncultured Proteiniphilum sp. TaxID=497637 RepID=UPI002638916F|nr:N-acetyltransferase [uncultured Proteiniphilum sp.]
MEGPTEVIRIYELDEFNYPKFRSKLIDLYLHAFTTGEYAQYIAPETVEVTLDGVLRDGSGCMAFVGDWLVGLLASLPLRRDPDFPVEECPGIPVGQTVYIAEVMVHADYRGRGIASRMMECLLRKVSEDYSYAVIRVWEKNRPAVELYKKLGFVPIAGISQKKLNADGEEFEMKKVYLGKKVKN